MPVTVNRSLRRLSAASMYSGGRRRGIVIEIHPDANGLGKPGSGFIGLRLSGIRRCYYLPVDWCFREAVRADLARTRAERKRLRAEKKARLSGR